MSGPANFAARRAERNNDCTAWTVADALEAALKEERARVSAGVASTAVVVLLNYPREDGGSESEAIYGGPECTRERSFLMLMQRGIWSAMDNRQT